MKTYPFISSSRILFLCATAFGAVSLNGQGIPDAPTVPDAPSVADNSSGDAPPTLAADELEELVGPIALYPDALVALILPASTVSSDVVLAARFLKNGGSVAQIESQGWEDSVKGLAHYPDVVKWMDENLSWTQRLGESYLAQPQAVMDAIQRARAIARSNGVLVDTPQQRVVVEDSYIRIIPAQRDVIYVPRYDPEIIYVQRPLYYHPDPWLTFGIGFGVGSWLSYDLDWRSRHIWVAHHRHNHWRHHHDWRHRHTHVDRHSHWRHWAPRPGHGHRPHRDPHRWSNHAGRPAPLPGAPRFDRERWKRNDRNHPIAGGGRPGVVRPDRTRNQVSETHSSRHRSGGFRRPGSGSNLTPGSTASSPQVAPERSTPRDEQRRREWAARNGANQSGVDRRFSGRRSERGTSSPAAPNRFQAPRGTNEAGIQGNSEVRGRPAHRERRYDRQHRQGGPSMRPAPVNPQQRSAAVAATQAPGVRPAPQREFRQAPRIAPSSAPARAPAAAPAREQGSRSNEIRASRGDHGSRSSASHGGGRGDGRSRGEGGRRER